MNEVAENMDGLFLGVAASGEEPWMGDINIRGSKVGRAANVTAIPEQVYKGVIHRGEKLEKAQKPLYGPGGLKLTVLGSATETLSYGERSTTKKIFLVRDLQVALLSRPASVRLKL